MPLTALASIGGTGGTTGIPKSRVVADDFRIDYEMFSDSLPDKFFPKGSNWLMLLEASNCCLVAGISRQVVKLAVAASRQL